MEEHIVRILETEALTPDVKRYRVARPQGYQFEPGQATEVAVKKSGWESESRPFTFTSRVKDPFLEFVIKSYRDHDGVTKQLDTLVPGDELLLHDVWGTIQFAGPGLFIAGGAGITPFVAIFRALQEQGKVKGNRLLFANKTEADVILKAEWQNVLGADFHSLVGQFVTKEAISSLYRKGDKVYLCGPDPMMDAVRPILKSLGVGDDLLVVEL